MSMQQGDIAMLTLGAGVAIYELTANDLLSEATDRYRGGHPWLTRLVIAAIAGHLSGTLPPVADIFSAQNPVHRRIVARYPLARRDRLLKKEG